MPELTARNVAFMVLMAATVAAVLAAVVLLVQQNDNAPVRIIAPDSNSQQEALTQVRVFVSGAVVSPGVYTLEPDSRIADALTAAGGATGDANLDGVNLALRLRDESEYYVPKLGEEPPATSSLLQTQTQVQNGGLIDLNLASVELLDTLPGIGPSLANAIVSYRENVRPFQSIAEIQEVPKIGPVTYQNMRDLVTVSGVR
ncbi:MAG: helix-hairpin-helix domain-containing protein [SAR202 cluster bacterium]|nr:helix-hairpin-helix domain-containing protein [SAR202 cluster bacterium]